MVDMFRQGIIPAAQDHASGEHVQALTAAVASVEAKIAEMHAASDECEMATVARVLRLEVRVRCSSSDLLWWALAAPYPCQVKTDSPFCCSSLTTIDLRGLMAWPAGHGGGAQGIGCRRGRHSGRCMAIRDLPGIAVPGLKSGECPALVICFCRGCWCCNRLINR